VTTASAPAQQRISVGIGQLAVTKDAGAVLIAYGLGSCVGVSVYDPANKVAAMVHVLLPASDKGGGPDPKEPARYADHAVEALIAQLTKAGGSRNQLRVKVAGGASVLGAANAQKFKIGERNAEAIKEQLRKHGLRVSAEDLGGERGRTMELFTADGRTMVRTAASPAREL
jgi:chemotaxis protein CheD